MGVASAEPQKTGPEIKGDEIERKIEMLMPCVVGF